MGEAAAGPVATVRCAFRHAVHIARKNVRHRKAPAKTGGSSSATKSRGGGCAGATVDLGITLCSHIDNAMRTTITNHKITPRMKRRLNLRGLVIRASGIRASLTSSRLYRNSIRISSSMIEVTDAGTITGFPWIQRQCRARRRNRKSAGGFVNVPQFLRHYKFPPCRKNSISSCPRSILRSLAAEFLSEYGAATKPFTRVPAIAKHVGA
jgi:hypothetical protein